MNEHTFSRKLKKLLCEYSPGTFSWKINDSFAGGVPDYFLEGDFQDLWVEVKFLPTLPKRPTTLINATKLLSPLQQEWLTRRHNRRGDTLVIIGTPKSAVLFWDNSWSLPIPTSEFIARAHDHRLIAKQISNVLSGPIHNRSPHAPRTNKRV